MFFHVIEHLGLDALHTLKILGDGRIQQFLMKADLTDLQTLKLWRTAPFQLQDLFLFIKAVTAAGQQTVILFHHLRRLRKRLAENGRHLIVEQLLDLCVNITDRKLRLRHIISAKEDDDAVLIQEQPERIRRCQMMIPQDLLQLTAQMLSVDLSLMVDQMDLVDPQIGHPCPFPDKIIERMIQHLCEIRFLAGMILLAQKQALLQLADEPVDHRVVMSLMLTRLYAGLRQRRLQSLCSQQWEQQQIADPAADVGTHPVIGKALHHQQDLYALIDTADLMDERDAIQPLSAHADQDDVRMHLPIQPIRILIILRKSDQFTRQRMPVDQILDMQLAAHIIVDDDDLMQFTGHCRSSAPAESCRRDKRAPSPAPAAAPVPSSAGAH